MGAPNQASSRDQEFLTAHIRSLVDFYYPVVIDHAHGGYFNGLRDDGTIYDRETRHLVGTCRNIYNFSVVSQLFDDADLLQAARHGLEFLQSAHRQPDGDYAWVLENRDVIDGTRHCYGHAFVLLAASTAAKAELPDSAPLIGEVFDLLESRFFEPDHGLYVDEIDADDWSAVSDYRGQNANMHMCEALLAAHEATGERRFLDRAELIARRICLELSAETNGLIWEHFTKNWSVDWTYNQNDPKNLFRPFGFLPGHFVEWSKLLILLHQHHPEPWMIERAEFLFAAAIENAWDEGAGGFNYTFDRQGTVLDTDRYYWVLSEAIAAAALLGASTGKEDYWRWYDRFWDYSDRYLIDHEHGGWYRVVDSTGKRYDDLKSPPAKTDYHPLSACHLALSTMQAS